MFCKSDDTGYKDLTEGITRKTLVYGSKTLMTKFKLAKGSIISKHRHSQYEQTGYLIKGKLRFFIDLEEFYVQPGDSWCIPIDTEHSVEVLEDSIAVEVFSPIRKDYI